MDVQSGLHEPIDRFEKSQKFLMPVPGQTFADDSSGEHIQSGEQGRRPVTLIVMRLPLRQTGT